MVKKQEIILRSYRHGDSQRKISKELGISRPTVKRYIEDYGKSKQKLCDSESKEGLIEDLVKVPVYNSEKRVKRKLTDDLSNEIDKLLKLNEQKRSQGQHKQILKKIDVLDYLHEKGFDIGYTSICNYISAKEKRSKEAYIRQEYLAGDVCEFDWGEAKLFIGGKLKVINMAVFTPAMSNYRYAVLFYRQDSCSFQQSHVDFFDHIGGVYKTMVYDNMRVAIRKFVGLKEKEPTEALSKLSMYYHFDFRFCNIRRGNEKGHVERSVEFVRRKAFSIQDQFETLQQANDWLLKVCDKLNSSGNNTNKKRAVDLLNIEKQYLYPTQPRFDCALMEQNRVDKYSTICYATNRYSVPDHLVGEIIDLKIYPERILCYHQNDKVCEHERRYSAHEWHIELGHYLKTLSRKPGALAGSCALKSAPDNVKTVYQEYFKNKPKEFVELLLFTNQGGVEFESVEKAIVRLKQICPKDISADKIKALCMQEQSPIEKVYNNNDPILEQSKKQLLELNLLLN